jgi:hypothetical protein
MARVKSNPLLQGMAGGIGKAILLRTFKKGTFSGKYPDMSGVVPSKNQTKGRERFAEAVKFAQSVMKDPVKSAEYKTRGGGSVYNAAVKEYMTRTNPDMRVLLSLTPTQKVALEALSLTEPLRRAIAYISVHKKITNGIYQEMNEVSKPTGTRHLGELARLGIIQSNKGKGAGAHYIIGSWWDENGLITSKQA